MSTEGSVRSYQVQWAPAWVSAPHLIGCEHLIQEFLQRTNATEKVSGHIEKRRRVEENVEHHVDSCIETQKSAENFQAGETNVVVVKTEERDDDDYLKNESDETITDDEADEAFVQVSCDWTETMESLLGNDHHCDTENQHTEGTACNGPSDKSVVKIEEEDLGSNTGMRNQ